MERWISELRQSLRSLLRRPGFLAVVFLTLGLGIGANTAVFSVIRGVLLGSLGFPQPGQLVMVWQTLPQLGIEAEAASPALFEDWRHMNGTFEAMSAFDVGIASLHLGETPEAVEVARVSPAFFSLLGVEPLHGRTLTLDEASPELASEVVLSYGLWSRLLGEDPAVVGRPLKIGSESYSVVGIMPEGFKFLTDTEIWMPLVFSTEDLVDRGDVFLRVVGRIRDGVTLEGAQANLDAVAENLAKEYPEVHR
ncbi:MAG: ABC transporter permease, partial [Acidobacteria bacterium]|nr:ABC transporter permease [Acidobacteriota bacterium]